MENFPDEDLPKQNKSVEDKEKKPEVNEQEMDEKELIEFLKANGPDNPKSLEYVRTLIDQKQQNMGPTSQDQLKFNLWLAEMYRGLGPLWIRQARDAYKDLETYAYQEHNDEFLTKAEEALNELGR